MNGRDQRYLRHILDAIAAIESFTGEAREQFIAERMGDSAGVWREAPKPFKA